MKYSIRSTLLTYLTLGLVVISALIVLLTYYIAGDELEELYDKNMQQMTALILDQTSDTHQQRPSRHHNFAKMNGEEDFLIQVWRNNDTLLYSSHRQILLPWQAQLGFGYVEFNHQTWHFYNDTMNDISVQISQPTQARQQVILEISSKFLIPLLLQIPILSLLIWLTVSKGLKPITNVSTAIEARGSGALHPLALDELPDEIKPMILALNELLARLGNALKVQQRFTADAAHELRTPLTAVQLQLDVLNRSQSHQDKQAALAKLNSGVKRSIHVVRQLLSLAHQEPEANNHQFAAIDLFVLLNECMGDFQNQIHQKNIKVSGPSSQASQLVNGNKSSLRILLDNLFDNSIRYTQPNGNIEISLETIAAQVILQVADDGIGIEPSERERVFDRFYRTLSSEESGTGLGLSIVKAIADQHDANIQLMDGIHGQGLRVQVIFSSTNI